MPRLDALLAKALRLPRRHAQRLLRSGRVFDESAVALRDPALRITPSTLPRTLRVDEAEVVLRTRFDLILHKPVGVVTALRDDRHATAAALVHDAPLADDLRAVGRLDLDTSGLLLWTTEGDLLHRLTHPRWAVPRTYHVGLRGPWPDPPPDFRLDDGHVPRIAALAVAEVQSLHPALRRSPEASAHATITLLEGRFHEVRRIFAALGTEVLDLCRVSYGPIELPVDLAPGAWRAFDLRSVFAGLHPSA